MSCSCTQSCVRTTMSTPIFKCIKKNPEKGTSLYSVYSQNCHNPPPLALHHPPGLSLFAGHCAPRPPKRARGQWPGIINGLREMVFGNCLNPPFLVGTAPRVGPGRQALTREGENNWRWAGHGMKVWRGGPKPGHPRVHQFFEAEFRLKT